VLHLRIAPSSVTATMDEYVRWHDLTIRPEDHNAAIARRLWSPVARLSTATASRQRMGTIGRHSEELTASAVARAQSLPGAE